MDSISPLAKILAEANGIDWHSIQGSGEGGSVVEQDILNYLSRIMSGDEEPPATPVDEAPAGWTGEMPPMPAAVAASGLQALSAAGVESDITDFVAQQQTGPAASSALQGAAATPEAFAAHPHPDQLQVGLLHPDHSQTEASSAPATSAAGPVTVTPPVPEYRSGQADAHDHEPEDEPEATDADMEFELDDDTDTDETPVYAAGSALTEMHHAEGHHAEGLQAVAEAPVAVIHPEAAEAHGHAAHDTVQHDAAQHDTVQHDTVQHAAVHDSPAYDAAPLDEEADFVLADSFPASTPAHDQAAHDQPAYDQATHDLPAPAHPVAATAEPVTEPAAPAPVVQEVAAAVGGFGLGGFLSRLYGNKAEPVPEPVTAQTTVFEPVPPEATHAEPLHAETMHTEIMHAEPVHAAAAQPEPAIGSAHHEHEVAPVHGEGHHEPGHYEPGHHEPGTPGEAEPVLTEPVLGEPLISRAPPMADSPASAPLVADQWRDQEAAPEQPEHGSEHDLHAAAAHAPVGEATPDAGFTASEPARAETTETKITGMETPEAETGLDGRRAEPHPGHPLEAQAAAHEAALPEVHALPEAHEGGLSGLALGAAGLGVAGLGAAGLAVAGLAAHAHHDQPHAAADVAPEAPVSQAAPVAPALPVAPPASPVVHGEAASEAPAESGMPADHGAAVSAPAASTPAVSAPAAPTPAASTSAEPTSTGPGPTPALPTSSAVTLRLNVDLGVLETARVQLSEALYREVPVTLLVARAAARSLSTLGLGTSGGVALGDHAGQPLAADLSGDFRASLAGLSEASHSTPALLVIDASELGLDELHRGECSLSVGRTVGESAALSLRGEVDPVRGAHFLHEVAGLLGTPIRLLF